METVVDVDWFDGAPLGSLVYERTYSRVMECGTKERWPDTARRVARGNVEFVDSTFIEADEEEAIYQLILNRQMIPAGRHLWVTGVPGRAFTQNCHVSGFETGLADHASFSFSELMKGGGVGANYSSHYLKDLPQLQPVHVSFISDPHHQDYDQFKHLLGENPHKGIVYRIPDSREGWVEALEMLLDAASHGGYTIKYDVTDIRPAGSPIKGFGGTASGPLALIEMLTKVAEHTKLSPVVTPETTMLIDHWVAEAVIAGNVRRSARMSIMHWKDPFVMWFLSCKKDSADHWSTNISVEIDNEFLHDLLDPDSHASEVYRQVIEGMLLNGEPGFYNGELASRGERNHLGSTNPCGEMPLESWESCNLGHINLAYGTDADHQRSFRLMARFLLRATNCDIQDPKQAEVVARNRRIGVGFFGLQEWLGQRGLKYSEYYVHGILQDNLSKWYNIVREEADKYADELSIPRPVKVTTIAPTGTIAKLAGTSEGMQAIYAKYYIRRVRYSETDPEVAKLRARGVPLEPCIYTANTVVASFPCEDPIMSRMPAGLVEEQSELSMEVCMGIQALVQRYYVDNAISLTINIPSATHEVKVELDKNLRKYLPHLKGTTVFPEASRPQSPIEAITKSEYHRLNALIQPDEIHSGESDQLIEDCQGGACPIR